MHETSTYSSIIPTSWRCHARCYLQPKLIFLFPRHVHITWQSTTHRMNMTRSFTRDWLKHNSQHQDNWNLSILRSMAPTSKENKGIHCTRNEGLVCRWCQIIIEECIISHQQSIHKTACWNLPTHAFATQQSSSASVFISSKQTVASQMVVCM